MLQVAALNFSRHGTRAQMVKAVGIFKNSGITTHSYIRQDGSDRTVYRFVLRTFKSQQSIEPRREIDIPTG